MYPTGTVTFIFSDIEGSTQIAQNHPNAWTEARTRHYSILEKAISAQHGYLFRTIGDEVNAAFETPLEALRAAQGAQTALLAEDWGEIGSLQVRMGLHSGPATLQDGEYEGYLTLSHAKRLVTAGHGGQVLVSEATAALLLGAIPEGSGLRDLGQHRLRSFEQAEHIFQLVSADLPAEFPALRTVEATPNNLPGQLTSFVGRAKEMNEIRQLLSKGRLVTLTGPGGSGKTRLAVQAALESLEDFRDGAFFIPLEPVSDPGLVPASIAQALSLRETAGRPILESIKNYLQNKNLLLIFDNFEQVISAAALITELLQACSNLKFLVTSREGLRLSGEQEYPVPPLALPKLSELSLVETIQQYGAVELFTQRAKSAKPDFRITKENAPVVAGICTRLDGLPLAIELAAARIKLLPPSAMLARLEHSLEFLTGGARNSPARQQTLRNTIAWSYNLLDEDEKETFRRLSVFSGGFTIETAEIVCGNPTTQSSIIDQIESLMDKSLLQQVEGMDAEPRFGNLQTLREFGLEQLEASGEGNTIRRRHAEFCLSLAEQAEASFASAEQVQWIQRLEKEHDNLRAALEWSRSTQNADELCWRLAGALGSFWETRGYFSEGRRRLASILTTKPAHGRTATRAKLLAKAAELAYRQSDYAATTSFAQESLTIYRELDDRPGMASALVKLGNAATEVGDYAAGSGYLDEALRTWRELGDQHGTARALISLGWIALRQGNYPLAKARLSEALALSREAGDTKRVGFELSGLGEVDLRQGDFRRASQLVEESLELRRQLGNQWGVGVSLGLLGWVAIRQGDWKRAIQRLRESLEVRREIGDQSGCAWCLERLAGVAIARGQIERAARLFGTGDALRSSVGSVIDPADRPEYESQIKYLRQKLGTARFQAAWDEGHKQTLEEAVAHAIEL